MIDGLYYDPKHGGCLRKIVLQDAQGTYKITGVYGNDEPNTGTKWYAIATKTKKKYVYLVDFSTKKFVRGIVTPQSGVIMHLF